MVALGKVRGNSMIDLQIMSTKLRDRAVRLVSELANCDYDAAQKRPLEASGWNLRAAIDSRPSQVTQPHFYVSL